MRLRTALAPLVASVLLAGLITPTAARAGRLDDAGRALREPGVWVDPDLAWLVRPEQARRLDREIDRAKVPVRVAVLPQLKVDESRGDQRAIVRAIIRRVDRDGLYMLVDQDGDGVLAARDLALDVNEFSFSGFSGIGRKPLSQQLAALVPIVSAAAPAPPRSFEPFANPQGIRHTFKRDGDPLPLIAVVCALLGAMAGFALYVVLRLIVAIADGRGSRGHA